MSPIIRVEDLTFEYVSRNEDTGEEIVSRAIDGVSFQIQKGEFVSVVGMNGSGKSTLARCLNGLLLPASGDVFVAGYNTRDDDTIWDLRSSIAMVFQNPDNQIVSSLVEDDVAFGPENLGVPPEEIRERVDEALKAVGMYDQRRKGAHQLSGGQKQRVAIAGAVAMRPDCIVFDEPTAMLDPQGRVKVMEIIRELNRRSITIVLITHFMEEAALSDRIIVMKDGRKLGDSKPYELFSDEALLREAGLEKPAAIEMRDRLVSRGFQIDPKMTGEKELVDWIVSARRTGAVTESRRSDEGKACPEGFSGKNSGRSAEHNVVSDDPGNDGESSSSATSVEDEIVAENVRYVYAPGLPDETVALEDISFRIPEGSFVGIIGHTGSGKSTLLQHMNGLLKPTSGNIWIRGTCITDGSAVMTDIRKRVGLVFQYPEYQLFEETVAKDVAFGPKNLGLTGDELEESVRKAIELVGLNYEKVRDKSPFELSGGQKRRVAIAGVLAMEPEVLILDEPTAGLDPQAHREILEMVDSIHRKRGNTMLFVSHNMADIQQLADQVMVIDKGRLKAMGTPEDVFSHGRELKEIGLGVPPATDIMMELRDRDCAVDDRCFTFDEAEREIVRYLEG